MDDVIEAILNSAIKKAEGFQFVSAFSLLFIVKYQNASLIFHTTL